MNLKNLDLSVLNNLKPEEKALALSILQEYSENTPSNMFGYIYLTINTVNNMLYIGKHKSNKFEPNFYKGSGKILRQAMQKEGRDKFINIILPSINNVNTICFNSDELNKSEKYYIEYYDCISSNQFYNLCEGGNGGEIYSYLSEEDKVKRNTKISDSLKETFANKDELYYKERALKKISTLNKLTDEEKLKRREVNSNAQLKVNKERSVEEKLRISEKHKQTIANKTIEQEMLRKQREKETKSNWSIEKRNEYLKKLSAGNLGKKRYTNGIDVINVIPGTEPEGYYLGGGNKNKYKFIYIYKDVEYNGKTLLFNKLREEYPNIKISNIDSILNKTPQIIKKYPELINKISRRDR